MSEQFIVNYRYQGHIYATIQGARTEQTLRRRWKREHGNVKILSVRWTDLGRLGLLRRGNHA